MSTISAVPSSYETSGAINGTRYQNTIGCGINNPSSSTGNDYAVGGTSSIATIYYKFDFSSIPNNAVITSMTVQAYGHAENTAKSVAELNTYYGTTAKGTAISYTSTSNAIVSISPGTWTISELKTDARVGFSIGYYGGLTTGITWTVEYTVGTTYTVTSTLTGNGTISPNGATSILENTSYTLTITPTDTSSIITAKKNNIDITSNLIPHSQTISGSTSAVLGTYTLVSGGFSGSGASYFPGIVGQGYDTSTTTTSNYYSSNNTTPAIFQYAITLNVPNNATITNLYMMANGHAESTTSAKEYMCVQLKSGNTVLSEQYNFKDAGSTNNSTQTIEATTLPTISQLSELVVECTLGYYGGAINGVTVFCEYTTEIPGTISYYTYTYTVTENATIAIIIQDVYKAYIKIDSFWVRVSKIYLKINNEWVEQSVLDWATLLSENSNYRVLQE